MLKVAAGSGFHVLQTFVRLKNVKFLNLPPNPKPNPVPPQPPPKLRGPLPRLDRSPGGLGPGPVRPAHQRGPVPAGPERVLAELTHVESGRPNDRPELLRAIACCKAGGTALLIAKLDRLTRNVAFIFALRDSGAQFVCADMPEANALTIGVMATMAQHDRAGAPAGGDLRPHEKGAGREEAGLHAGHPGQPDAGGHCGGDGPCGGATPARTRTTAGLRRWLIPFGRAATAGRPSPPRSTTTVSAPGGAGSSDPSRPSAWWRSSIEW